MSSKFDDEKYEDRKGTHVRLYTIDGDQMTFEQIKQHCPHVTEKMIRDRLFRGERKMARLSRPPDSRKGVDKPKSWR
ncbi:MAG: hypothetical protein ACREO4_09315 [Lysobacter sp.]